MGFWGIEVKPDSPYTVEFDHFSGALHVTQATLGDGSSNKKSVVQCTVGDKNPVFLCSLLPDKIETSPLNLEFENIDPVIFSVNGPRSVHLSGFFEGTDQEYIEDDSDSIGLTNSEESSDYDSEEEFDSDFDVFPPSHIPNSGVVIEEIVDDEKPANATSQSKQLKKNKHPVLETEDEDGFPVAASTEKSKLNNLTPNSDAEKKIEQNTAKETKKKRRRDDSDIQERLENQQLDSSNVSACVPESDTKKKNPKRQKQQIDGKKVQAGDEKKVDNKEDPKLKNEKNLVSDGNATEDKKKKNNNKNKKKTKTQETGGDAEKGKTVIPKGDTKGSTVALDEKKDKSKPTQVRTYPNGLVIEELAMGKPAGKRANPGDKVVVRYIGKLKKNGSIFDSNVGKAPFKFRLGVGQVIKGWDVGVNGMRVGDKRRLTIPPSMGYGAEGASRKIPPNSWLEFEVELVNVN